MAGGTVTPLAVLEEIWAGAKDAVCRCISMGRESSMRRLLWASCRGADARLRYGDVLPVEGAWRSSWFDAGWERGSDRTGSNLPQGLGGGMRQAGVLAAAGLIALEEMPKRLAEDHVNARLLAERLAELPEVMIDLGSVQTNIVIFSLKAGGHDALLARLRARGLILGTMGPTGIRLVTHHDVSQADCERAAEILVEEIRRN